MSVRITNSTSNVKLQVALTVGIFLRRRVDELIELSTPGTPKKEGNLRQDILKQVLGFRAKVKWGKNYGYYQETRQYKNYTTPGTGPHFAENAARKLAGSTEKII